MILIDMNQLCIANIFMQAGMNKEFKGQIDQDLVRHMILNNIRSHRLHFVNKGFGEVIICCDDKHSWRKDFFPYYKAHRKKDREASFVNWKQLFECLEKVKAELKSFMPYHVIQVTGAEADDIIAVLATSSRTERTVIVSSDKDYVQLHTDNVHQFCPRKKKFITYNDTERNNLILEHLINGDRGDGIPNILSDDDTFVAENKKQKKMTADRMNYFKTYFGPRTIEQMTTTAPDPQVLLNYQRNKTLIDFKSIPTDIQNKISEQLGNEVAPRSMVFDYFVKFKLKNLMDSIGDF